MSTKVFFPGLHQTVVSLLSLQIPSSLSLLHSIAYIPIFGNFFGNARCGTRFIMGGLRYRIRAFDTVRSYKRDFNRTQRICLPI